jgi:beta-hydroxylase
MISAIWVAPAVVLAAALASMGYVYRIRGTQRFSGLSEYLRKGWPVFAPLNCLLYACTRPHGRAPILKTPDFPEFAPLREHWQTIRDEALELKRLGFFEQSKDKANIAYYDVGFRTFAKYGWSKFYLKWYGYTHHSAQELCPRTVEILKGIPEINGAMFSLLPANSILSRHLDPVASSLRLHMGLATPNRDECWIDVDGTKYSWRDGEILLFDETFLHHVRNDTEDFRLLLMCDVRRPLNLPGRLINGLVQVALRMSVVPNTSKDRRGLANILFHGLVPALDRLKALKQTNRPLYLLIKWTINLGLIAIALALVGLLVWGASILVG